MAVAEAVAANTPLSNQIIQPMLLPPPYMRVSLTCAFRAVGRGRTGTGNGTGIMQGA